MITIEGITLPVLAPEKEDRFREENGQQPGYARINGAGTLVITNTGGSSASEGGMGSGSEDDREKGSLSKPGEKGGSVSTDDDDDTTFDPIKKSVKEAEKARDKE